MSLVKQWASWKESSDAPSFLKGQEANDDPDDEDAKRVREKYLASRARLQPRG
ncbi:MAG: hypothetical protein KF850_19950 [Labilithrix sp.]|nr:hypothetical protein [Labilithrix sp.]MBX3214318.1 hypothetical protein [Labilithrix sp.]